VDALLAQLAAARSFLVFPGDDDRKRARALGSDADAVVLDLEDGVAAAARDDARSRVASFAAEPGAPARLVRVNDPTGAEGALDLAAVERLAAVAVVVPKAGLASVSAAAVAGRPLVALIEDAAGIRDAYGLAEHPAVVALAIGSADLGAALGLVPDGSGAELAFTRAQLVVASAAARIRPPVDGPCLDVRDAIALERETRQARALGLRGKLCIHPGQVGGVHRALAPSGDEVERARRIMAGWEELQARGDAVGVVDGSLVDLPVAARARAIVEASEGSESG
jgi:citrate lyase subunit beta / citryl-CoA lyase